jgi:peptidoglycan/xylan/chitin deacetylase (PgdA/CDA1 family)
MRGVLFCVIGGLAYTEYMKVSSQPFSPPSGKKSSFSLALSALAGGGLLLTLAAVFPNAVFPASPSSSPKISGVVETFVPPEKQPAMSVSDQSVSDQPPAPSQPVSDQPVSDQSVPAAGVPVLMYHYVRTLPVGTHDYLGYQLSVSDVNFEEQMRYLANTGYTTLAPEEFYNALSANKLLPEKPVMLTFDDGYEDFYTNAFPILKKYQLKAALFVIANLVGDPLGRYVTWEQLREMESTGLVFVGSHTLSHPDLTVSRRVEREIFDSKTILEEKLGHSVTFFAYPSGRFNARTEDLVKAAGYQAAFTTLFGGAAKPEQFFHLPRVRISGGLDFQGFIDRLNFRLAKQGKMENNTSTSPVN